MKFGGFDLDGSGDARGGDFGEHAVHVFPPAGVARAAGPVGVERISKNHAGLPCFFEAPAHGRAHEIVAAMDERIDELGDGIGVGRNVNARTVFAHLMLVEPELRKPFVVDHAVYVFGFDLREHEPVAVVVVADVVMIEVGHLAALVLGAEIFSVPLGDHDFAIGIERRDEEDDGIVEAAENFRILRSREIVSPLHGHLAGADFRGVNVAGEEEDGFAVVGELIDLLRGEAAGIGEFLRDRLCTWLCWRDFPAWRLRP